MTVKSLKKQLAAAVAMVLVALIALSSSTYAWFANNNQVFAKTSTISAQTNAASLVIKYNASAVDSDQTTDYATIGDTPLYPAQWSNNFDSTGATTGTKIYQFETAFASSTDASDMKAGSLTVVGAPAKAVDDEYAVLNMFKVTSKGDNMTDLKVVDAEISDTGNTYLDSALRVLVVCGDNWVVCDKDGVVSSSSATQGLLAGTITAGTDTEVDMYVYYDGNDGEIYTNNLTNLTTASAKIMVTLEATDPNA